MVALGLVIAQVVLAAPPVANFDISDTVPEIDQSVSFTSTVTDEDLDETHSFSWDFGDGESSTAENPSHAYETAGVKTVTLTVTDSADPSESTTVTHQLRVNAPPSPAFGFTPSNPNPSQPLTFTSSSSDPEGGLLLAWDLDDDGAFDDGSDPVEIWSFGTGGNHTVGLRVTDSDGVQRTTSQTVSVFNNTPPVASFTVTGANPVTPAVPDVGEAISLTSTSTDTDGSITRMDWDLDNDGAFDDGSRSPMPLQFQTSGQKTVGLRVQDSSGGTHSTTQQFRVNALPTAAINISNAEREPGQKRTVPLEGQDFIFTSANVLAIPGASPAPGCPALTGSPAGPASSDPEGPLSTFEWDLDNDGLYGAVDAEPVGATAASPVTGYPAGPRTVGLGVTDSDGAPKTRRRWRSTSTPHPLRILSHPPHPRCLLAASARCPPSPLLTPLSPPPPPFPPPPPPPGGGAEHHPERLHRVHARGAVARAGDHLQRIGDESNGQGDRQLGVGLRLRPFRSVQRRRGRHAGKPRLRECGREAHRPQGH